MSKGIATINMSAVKSSQLSSIGYDEKTNTMAVKFNNGGTYHYENVTKGEFDKFSKAESIGKYFGANFKNRPFKKLPVQKAK